MAEVEGAAPAGKPKKPFYKKWWFWVIAVLVVGAIGSGASGGDGGSTASTDTAEKPAASAEPAANTEEPKEEPKEEAAKIGTPLTVGDLVFTVSSAKPTTELKSPLGNKTGSWIVVAVKVENKGKEAVMMDGSFFKLLDAEGATYETDSDNLMYLDPESNFFLENINPNMSKEGQVLFAVPEGLKDTKLQVQTGVFGTETGVIVLSK